MENVLSELSTSSSSENPPSTERTPKPKSLRDVALSFSLNEIADQARSNTAASGSAILLVESGVSLCEAVSGSTAREISEYLHGCLALSNKSWNEGTLRCCDDVETDAGFDPSTCRHLGIRSFVIFPVKGEDGSVRAILEIFSSYARAFSARDHSVLEDLGQRVNSQLRIIERALATDVKAPGTAQTETLRRRAKVRRFARLREIYSREAWNICLGSLTILLAILLGWFIGRSERESSRRLTTHHAGASTNNAQIEVTSKDSTTSGDVQVAGELPNTSSIPTPANGTGGPPLGANARRPQHTQLTHPLPKASLDEPSSDIIIFEKGEQIFPIRSLQSPEVSKSRKAQNSAPASEDQEPPLIVSEEIAEQHLLQRVEPDYPKSVREQQLQGAVLLDIHVGKDGTVRSLSCVTGDSRLCLLAARAVRQWRFAPLVREGAAVSFNSQIGLNFLLP